jgi:dTMP kinase
MLNHYAEVPHIKKKGIFIVMEGLDGSGKTTQAKLLAANLQPKHKVLCTAEPSRGKIGTYIRNNVLYEKTRASTVMEALLFAADRIEHIQNEVQPALDEGQLVICDRYTYSSLAYQGSAGLNLEWIQTINQHALKPDLALFIDVPPEAVLQRLKRKKSVMENLETQRRVREIYQKYIAKGELIRVDGEKPKDEVAQEIFKTVSKFLET